MREGREDRRSRRDTEGGKGKEIERAKQGEKTGGKIKRQRREGGKRRGRDERKTNKGTGGNIAAEI